MAQSAIIFSLTASYGTGHVIAILITIMALWVVLGSFLRLTVKGTTDTLIMEIPPYRLPGFKVLMRNLGTLLYEFLTDAFPYVLGGILFVNILTMLGVMDFLGNLAKPVISGVFGLPSEAVSSYLIGIVRKDASVALLEPLALNGVQMITGVTTLIIYFPCMATFVVLLKELGFKDTAKSMLIMVEVTILTGTWVRLTMLIVHNSPWLYTLVTALFAITVMVVANRKAMQKSSESL